MSHVPYTPINLGGNNIEPTETQTEVKTRQVDMEGEALSDVSRPVDEPFVDVPVGSP